MAKRSVRNTLIVGVCLVVACVLLGRGTWRLLAIADERIWMGAAAFDRLPFNRTKWLHYQSDQDPNIRKRMYHDLRSHHLKPGMTRASVLRLLGQPTSEGDDRLGYYLGPDALKMDTNELVVEFGSRGRLTRVRWSET